MCSSDLTSIPQQRKVISVLPMANPKNCKREEIRTLTTIRTRIQIKKKKKKNKRLPLRETSSTKVQTLIKLKRVSFMVKQPLRKRERERERVGTKGWKQRYHPNSRL